MNFLKHGALGFTYKGMLYGFVAWLVFLGVLFGIQTARIFNFEKELFVHVNILESRATKGNEKALEKARSHIRDRLTQLAPVFLKNKYMLGDNFSMLDVAIAPLLWRLDYYGIDLSKNAAPLLKYAERIFSRPAYIEALTPSEKVMRK